MNDGSTLTLFTNVGETAISVPSVPPGACLYAYPPAAAQAAADSTLLSLSTVWSLAP